MIKMKKAIAMLSALALGAGALSGCGGEQNDENTLKFMFWGDVPTDMQLVLDEFAERTKDTLGFKLEFSFTPVGEYKNLLSMKMAAGEQVDAVFDAQWNGMEDKIRDGYYQDLSGYFNNDEYMGLKENFSEEFLQANMFGGKVIGIPLHHSGPSIEVVAIRKDLREKYGVGEVNSIETLEAYFDAIRENEPNMYPLSVLGSTDGVLRAMVGEYGQPEHRDNIYKFSVNNIAGNVWIEDGTVKAITDAYSTDEDKAASGMPAPYDSNSVRNSRWVRANEWYKKGYVSQDIMNVTDAEGPFKAGKAAALRTDLVNYPTIKSQTESAIAGAEVEFCVVSDAIRNKEQESFLKTQQAHNYVCIPTTSKNVDKTMAFFNWLFESSDNHDLFEYGIEGVHWNKVGDDQYSIPEDKKNNNYSFPGYQLSWNDNYIRYDVEIDEGVLEYLQFGDDPANAAENPLDGFVFDSSAVDDEMKIISADKVAKVAELPYMDGIIDNPVEDFNAKLQQSKQENAEFWEMYDKVVNEIKVQIEEYIAK